jgi:two-component system, response regulator YesN
MRSYKAFYRFLFFYALIFFIPFTFSIVAYLQFTGIVERQEIDANLKLIQKTRDELDEQIIEVEQIVDLLSHDQLVLKIGFQSASLTGDSLFAQWQLANRLGDLLQTNNFISSLYVYFSNIERVVMPGGAVDERIFYGNHIQYGELTLPEWKELFLHTPHERDFLPTSDVQIGSQRLSMLTYIQSLLVDQSEGTRAVAWLFVDAREIHRVVRSLSEEYQVSIIDENGIVLASSARVDATPDFSTMSFSEETGYVRYSVDGIEMILSYTASNAKPWHIVTTVPASIVASRTRLVRRELLIVTIVMSILGIGVALLLARRSAKPINELMQVIERNRTTKSAKPGIRNEFELIKNDFLHLVSDKMSLQEELRRQLPMLQSAFFERLYMGEFTDEQEILQVAGHLELEFSGVAYCTVLLKFYFPNSVDHRSRLNELFSARSMIKKILTGQDSPIYMHDRADDEITILLCLSDEELSRYMDHASALIEPVSEALKKDAQIDFVVAAGHPRSQLKDIWQAFQECLEALDSIHAQREASVYWYTERKEHLQSFYFPTELETRLINNAKVGNAKQVQNLLSTIHVENAENRSLTPHMNRLLINNLQCALTKILYQMNASSDDEGRKLMAEADRLRHIHSFDDAYTVIQNVFNGISAIGDRNKKSHKTEIVKEINAYLAREYVDSGLNRHRVASAFNMSEGYFSSFFKEQTGTSFTECLEELRLRHAIDMLSVNGQTIASIAKSVGYASEKAFSRAFKRAYGVNPSRYRGTNPSRIDRIEK